MSQDMDKEAIRVGWQVGTSLADTLRIAIITYHNTFGTKADREAKKQMKGNLGKEFSKRDRFVAHNKAKDVSKFESTHLRENELKLFKKLSKSYGLDVLIEKKPDGLEGLMAKPVNARTNAEKTLLGKWTTGEGTGTRLVKDDYKITIAAKDVDILEMVVEDMAERTYNLEQRIVNAKETKEEMMEEALDQELEDVLGAFNKSLGKQMKDAFKGPEL